METTYLIARLQFILFPKLLLNIPGSVVGLIDFNTTAIDDCDAPYALRSGIGDFRDADFLYILTTRIFLDRCQYLLAHLCSREFRFSHVDPCACRRVPSGTKIKAETNPSTRGGISSVADLTFQN